MALKLWLPLALYLLAVINIQCHVVKGKTNVNEKKEFKSHPSDDVIVFENNQDNAKTTKPKLPDVNDDDELGNKFGLSDFGACPTGTKRRGPICA
ncbi:jg7055 [Pararge aegeria aegeria]|uniref:Jg7055 protein n=1 Tax=Pararge aegeria aegeria TaxID=348720 RepID=A0A8S4RKB3_9NEOP|nr:jg7055 [Pararge aegeria aegeria]